MEIINTAEILTVGTELLLGDIVNTNAAFLSRQLADLGISVFRHTSVGDNPERLFAAVASAAESADLVVMSGGLGPTYDDITKETVAKYFGLELIRDDRIAERLKKYFKSLCRIMTENNLKQSLVPENAVVFENNYGTAPAFAVTGEGKAGKRTTVIMLPGPPGELIPIFREEVLPYLKCRRAKVFVSKNINLFGIGESSAEEILKNLMVNSKNPTVAPYCKEGEVRLRVTASAADEDEAAGLCDGIIEVIEKTEIGKYIYGIDVKSIEYAAVKFLRENSMTLAVAESCTGGLVSKLITDMPGVSDVYLGGVISYANGVKAALLGVDTTELERFGAVSAEVAQSMAKGVRAATGSDIGVSTTGIAGPDGGTAEKPVGCVYIAIATNSGCFVKKLSLSSMRGRDYIRAVTAENVFDLILNVKNHKYT